MNRVTAPVIAAGVPLQPTCKGERDRLEGDLGRHGDRERETGNQKERAKGREHHH
jgi:hypothetical protein